MHLSRVASIASRLLITAVMAVAQLAFAFTPPKCSGSGCDRLCPMHRAAQAESVVPPKACCHEKSPTTLVSPLIEGQPCKCSVRPAPDTTVATSFAFVPILQALILPSAPSIEIEPDGMLIRTAVVPASGRAPPRPPGFNDSERAPPIA